MCIRDRHYSVTKYIYVQINKFVCLLGNKSTWGGFIGLPVLFCLCLCLCFFLNFRNFKTMLTICPRLRFFFLEYVLACGRSVKYNRRICLDEWDIYFLFLSRQTTKLNNCLFAFSGCLFALLTLKALNFLELSFCQASQSNTNNLL